MRVIDLNCHAGGFLLGLKQAGFEPVFASGNPLACKVAELNFSIPTMDVVGVPSDKIPHADLIVASGVSLDRNEFLRISLGIRPRAMAIEFQGRDEPFLIRGYYSYLESLAPSDFGLPMRARRTMMVAFREDVRKRFLTFQFPDPTRQGAKLGEIEISAVTKEPASLTMGQASLDRMSSEAARRRQAGMGFSFKVLGKEDQCPSLSRYHKDGSEAIVDFGNGPRRLSTMEVGKIMGFPEDWNVPGPSTNAYRLLGRSVCPPVAKALGGEIDMWLSDKLSGIS